MSSVNDDFPTHVFAQLGSALAVARRLMEGEIAGETQHLRGSHVRLLSLTPHGGIRPTELAARVGMTKQSLGEFVAALQEAGFLQVDVDPSDRRARIISPTAKGIRLQKRVLDIFAEQEDRWRRAVGPRNWAVFRRVLAQLAAER